MTERSFGWMKDRYRIGQPTYTDHLMKINYDFAKPLPPTVDLFRLMPEVRDQGNLGSCTGFGIGVNLTARAREQGVYVEWFSPEWIYNGARFIEGTLMFDNGAAPSDCWDWLVEKGALLEHFWPYNGNKLDKRPPPSGFDVYAAKYPVITYYRVDNGTKGLQLSLSVGNLISIGTPWPSKWVNDVKADGILPEITPDDEIAGGHETCLFGYKEINGKLYFHGRNSWGNWGELGNYWMPASAFEVFKIAGGYDSHFPRLPWGK
jgi:hypothetical protein